MASPERCATSSPTVANVTVVEARRVATRLDIDVLVGAPRWVLVANLPYNVATPLVCDLLDFVPAVRADAGDGAARGGRAIVRSGRIGCVRRRQREGGVLGDGANRRHRASQRVPAATQGRVGTGRHPSATGRRPSMFRPSRCSSWCAQHSDSAARCCADRWPMSCPAEVFEAAGIDAQRRPEELDIVEWGALTPCVAGGARERRRCDGTGQADAEPFASQVFATTAIHLHRCRDGDARLARHADDRSASSGLTADGPFALGHAVGSIEPRRPGVASSSVAPPQCTSTRRCHAVAASVAVRQTRPRSLRWAGYRRSDQALLSWAPMFPSVSSAAVPRFAGSARSSNRCRSNRSTSPWSSRQCR